MGKGGKLNPLGQEKIRQFNLAISKINGMQGRQIPAELQLVSGLVGADPAWLKNSKNRIAAVNFLKAQRDSAKHVIRLY